MSNTNPVFCRRCNKQVDAHHWKWEKDERLKCGGRWRCKMYVAQANRKYRHRVKSDPIRNKRYKEYHKQYSLEHAEITRFKSLKSFDKKRGFVTDISLDSYRDMISKTCYYCGKDECGGLDRMDNTRGHVWGNVVPCCEKCNNILCDIPFVAKEKLKAGLHEIQRENLLQNWTIPTKRQVHHV